MCPRGDVCEGCERCLTPTAWRHFLRLREAREANSHLTLVIRFLQHSLR